MHVFVRLSFPSPLCVLGWTSWGSVPTPLRQAALHRWGLEELSFEISDMIFEMK